MAKFRRKHARLPIPEKSTKKYGNKPRCVCGHSFTDHINPIMGWVADCRKCHCAGYRTGERHAHTNTLRNRREQSRSPARAKELVKIHVAIREAPEAIDVREGQADDLHYFIKRSDACQLDLNDKDAMMRTIGLLDDTLDEADGPAG